MHKKASGFLFLFFLLLALPFASLAYESSCPASFSLMGQNTSKAPVTVRQKGGEQSPAVASIPREGRCEVLCRSGAYYKVIYGGKTGYVKKTELTLYGKSSSQALPEAGKNNLSLQNYIPKSAQGSKITFQGTIPADQPIDSLEVYLWDERQMRSDLAYLVSFSSPRKTIDMAELQSRFPLAGALAGRKTVVVQAVSKGKSYAVFRTLLSIRGPVKEPAHITGKCTVSSKDVTDSSAKTIWTPSATSPSLTVKIPADARPSLLTITWKSRPDRFTVELFDENNESMTRETLSTNFFVDHFFLDDTVRRVVITPHTKKCSVSSLRVYGQRYDEHTVQKWQQLPEKTDILFFSTHCDDELLFFGGAIPYYSYKGAKVAVVYATNNGRTRYQEALDGMWAAGLRYHPVFLGWHNFDAKSVKGALGDWKMENGDVQKKLVRVLRQYKPDVVVTQGFDGEYGHPQHKATAQLMAKAIQLAADPEYDEKSAAQYGVWQIKKMYAHRYKQNTITMNWSKPLTDDGIITPLFLAKEGYDRHQSQHRGFSMEVTGKQYDNRKFGLYFTAVGPDTKKNDFLENVPAE